MKISKQLLLITVITLIGLFSGGATAKAQNINYQTFKYGTSQTSMADGYYARPAQVNVSGNQYVVTMTIHTGEDLGAWPVTVLTIDGQSPQNVSKLHGNGYDYTYSFTTKNLNRTISSSIAIDVPGVYKANHNISFKFDTSGLPALNGKQDAAGNETKASGTNTATSPSNTNNIASGVNDPNLKSKLNKLNAQAAAQSSQAKKKESQLARQTLRQNAEVQATNARNQRLFYFVIVGGIIGIIIILAAAIYFVRSASKHIPRH